MTWLPRMVMHQSLAARCTCFPALAQPLQIHATVNMTSVATVICLNINVMDYSVNKYESWQNLWAILG